MGSKQQMLKLFLVLLLSTAFIFGFSHFGAQAYQNLAQKDGIYHIGTYIGTLDVSGKTKDAAVGALQENYINWLKDTKITLQYQEKTAEFELDKFHLDANETMNTLKDGEKNTARITIDQAKVKEQLQLLFPEQNVSQFNVEKLTVDLSQLASKFESGKYNFDLYDNYLLSGVMKKDEAIGTTDVALNEIPEDLINLISNKSKIDIPVQSTFSLLNYLKQNDLQLDSASLNILATGIYQLVLPTNFTFDERNIGHSLPDYAKAGYEAIVNPGENADLIFKNPNKSNYLVKLELDNNRLKLTLVGEKLYYSYKISVENVQTVAPRTIVQYSPSVSQGQMLVQTNGRDGQLVRVYRQEYLDEQFVKSDKISEDYYPPLNRVEIHSLIGGNNASSQKDASQTTNSIGSQTGTNINTSANIAGSQTGTSNDTLSTTSRTQAGATTSDVQPVSNQTNLWGQPNEQPK